MFEGRVSKVAKLSFNKANGKLLLLSLLLLLLLLLQVGPENNVIIYH